MTNAFVSAPEAFHRLIDSAQIGAGVDGYRYPDIFRYAGENVGEADRLASAEYLASLISSDLSEDDLMRFWFDTQTYVVMPPHTREFTRQVIELLIDHLPPGPPPYG